MSDTQGMDISQQQETYRHFVGMVKFGIGGTVVVLILMALFLT
jgi:hypothetical protein